VHDPSSDVAVEVTDAHWPPSMFTVGFGFVGGLVKKSKHPALSTELMRAMANDVLVMRRALLLRPAGACPVAGSVSL
jgi:hypothetical protein